MFLIYVLYFVFFKSWYCYLTKSTVRVTMKYTDVIQDYIKFGFLEIEIYYVIFIVQISYLYYEMYGKKGIQ